MSQADIIARAGKVLPAATFGNFPGDIIIREGKGAYVWDEEGNKYIDYLIGSGPMLIGHGHPEVLQAVHEQVEKGMTFFANNEAGIKLAEEILKAMPSGEQLRYVSSGGEADMYAIRLARAYKQRDKILKFEGGYHGMSAEAQMSLAPKQAVELPAALPDSAGIPAGVAAEMLISRYNDLDFTRQLMEQHKGEIAAIIVEPLQRIIPPQPGFLQGLRDLCDEFDTLLIFDEVVTCFRFAYGGAQEYYGVKPDITTMGKIIGGGFPLAALIASEDIMSHFDAKKAGNGWLMQLGTLSGNPVASVAGLKTMEILRRPGQYERLNEMGTRLMKGLSDSLTKAGHAHQVVGEPSLFEVVFSDQPISNYRDVLTGDSAKMAAFNKVLRQQGIFKSAGKWYPNLALSDEDIDFTLAAIEKAAQAI